MLYLLVTGASSGLGEALVDVASQERGTIIVGLSRRGNPRLDRRVAERGSTYIDHRFDLANPDLIQNLSTELFRPVRSDCEAILINNAAVEGPLGRLGNVDLRGLIDHININLTASMVLAGEFIRHTEGTARRTIVNITSGAAQHPYDGLSAYCASKAGLDMFGRCVALEQKDAVHPVRVLGIAPGVLETEMQDRLRAAPDGVFASRERFVALKREGKLASPAEAARRILTLARSDDYESGALIDLRTLT